MTGTLRVVSEGGCEMFPFGSFVKSKKMEMRERAGKTLAPPGGLKRPNIAGYQQRKKRVIMGRDFLLVSRTCLQGANKKFQFFHTSSLSAVEVKIKMPSLKVCFSA